MAGEITVAVDPNVAKVFRLASKSERCKLGPARELALVGIRDHAGGRLNASEESSGLNFRMQPGRACGPGGTDTAGGLVLLSTANEV